MTTQESVPLTGALGNANRLKLGTFATNLERGGSVSTAPDVLPARWEAVLRAAQLCDRMGMELLVPVARWKGFGGATNYAGASFETLTWAAGLLAATQNIHVFATCHVPVVHPILAAKQLATIDHISDGRSGLNVVGGWHRPEIEMFGVELLEHDRRYEMAEEWTDIVRRLWMDKDEFDHKGEFFDLRGAFCEPKPVQSPRPPIMNAGGSGRGQRFAAEYAELVYVFLRELQDLDAARATASGYKATAREQFGREVSVWTAATVFCGDTEEEARELEHFFCEETADFDAVDNMLATMGIESAVLGDQAPILRRRFIAGWGGVPLVGTPEQIAEGLQFISDAGCDGCLLMFPRWDEGLTTFRERVMPVLEQAGFREPYEGGQR